MYIDHVTIRTSALVTTRDFMVEVFDLIDGPRPATIVAAVNGYWLYHNDSPLVHLIESNLPADQVEHRAEAIDHFAFIMQDYDGFKAKLTRMEIPFTMMDLPEMNRKRIFLHTPDEVLIETIFL